MMIVMTLFDKVDNIKMTINAYITYNIVQGTMWQGWSFKLKDLHPSLGKFKENVDQISFSEKCSSKMTNHA